MFARSDCPHAQTGTPPILSVAIASRNNAAFLPRAVASALRAAAVLGLPFEIVVVDDASTDNTREILEAYRLRHPGRVKPVYRRTSRGVAAAKNTALAHCSGRTLALLDADDEFLPEKLARCVGAIASGEVDLVTHDCIYWRINQEHYLMDPTRWAGAEIDFWPPSSWVVARGKLRFNEQMIGGAEDLEWLFRAGRHLRKTHLHVPLNIQYEHAGHIGATLDSAVPACQMVGRLRGRPHAYDQQAPVIRACARCGRQLLLPAECCGQSPSPSPLLYYSVATSESTLAPPTEFSFLFLTRNRLELTRRAVTSLLACLGETRAELIFVDGGSTDGTLASIQEWGARLPVKLVAIPPEERFNYSRNCNRGARAAVGAYLVLLNNDIEIGSDDLVATLRAALSDPRVGVAGVSSVWQPGQREPEWDRKRWPYVLTRRPPCGYLWGVRREVYWELGGLDEAFTAYGYEELDFEYRALEANYRLALVASRVAHVGAATFTAHYDGAALSSLEKANRALFEQKHGRPIYCDGDDVQPFAAFLPPARSVVIAARNAGGALRRTLEAAAREPHAYDGSTQIVAVNNASEDDTALVLAHYRRRLPRLLNMVDLERPVDPGRAIALGAARAIGARVEIRHPGDRI